LVALDARLQQLDERLLQKPYNKKKWATVKEFSDFLVACPLRTKISQATPEDVRRFLVWKEKRGKTQIHEVTCSYLGKVGIYACACPLRLSSGSVSNIVAHLKSAYQLMGRGTQWCTKTQEGNPATASIVQDYLSAIKEEQAESHVLPHQAKPLFMEKLKRLAEFWQRELEGYLTQVQRFIILRDRAFFTLQFFAGDRAHDLSLLLGQEIKILQDNSGMILRLTFGKQWRGDAHSEFVVPRCSYTKICPVEAMQQYLEWGAHLGLNLQQGYIFRLVSKQREVSHNRFNSAAAYKQLKSYLQSLGINEGETPHGIRGGSAISLVASGATESEVMAHVGWKSQESYSHYTRSALQQSSKAAQKLVQLASRTAHVSDPQFSSLGELYPLFEANGM
jgi:site-specific recombinase XerD